jgi:hypothetical protein
VCRAGADLRDLLLRLCRCALGACFGGRDGGRVLGAQPLEFTRRVFPGPRGFCACVFGACLGAG